MLRAYYIYRWIISKITLKGKSVYLPLTIKKLPFAAEKNI